MATSLTSIMTDLRKSFGASPSSTDGANTSSTAQKSTPKIRMTRVLPEYACMVKCTDLGIDVVAALPPTFSWTTSAHYDTPFRDAVSSMTNDSTVGRFASGAMSASGLSMITQTLTAKFWSGSDSGAITLPLVFQAHSDEVTEVMQPVAQLMSLTVPRTLGNTNGGVLQAPGPHFDMSKAATQIANSHAITVAGQRTLGQNAQSALDFMGLVKGTIKSLADMNNASAAKTAVNGAINGVTSALNSLDTFARNNIVNNVSLQIGRFMMFDHVVITNVSYDFPVQPVGASYGYSTGNFQRAEVSITFEPFFDLTQRDLATIFLDPRLRAYFEQLINRNQKAKF